MDEIGALEMPPVHVSPKNSEGIVLVVEVIFPVSERHAVRVIVPTSARGGMELVAVWKGIVTCREGVGRDSDPDLVQSFP